MERELKFDTNINLNKSYHSTATLVERFWILGMAIYGFYGELVKADANWSVLKSFFH
jgi:hypothetical protein